MHFNFFYFFVQFFLLCCVFCSVFLFFLERNCVISQVTQLHFLCQQLVFLLEIAYILLKIYCLLSNEKGYIQKNTYKVYHEILNNKNN